jgi:hypothetical protein
MGVRFPLLAQEANPGSSQVIRGFCFWGCGRRAGRADCFCGRLAALTRLELPRRASWRRRGRRARPGQPPGPKGRRDRPRQQHRPRGRRRLRCSAPYLAPERVPKGGEVAAEGGGRGGARLPRSRHSHRLQHLLRRPRCGRRYRAVVAGSLCPARYITPARLSVFVPKNVSRECRKS